MKKYNRTLRVLLLMALSIAAFSCGGGEQVANKPAGSDTAIPDDLRRAMNERAEAIFQARSDDWDRLTAADFTVVQPDGRLMTKTERLAELRTQTPSSVPAEEHEYIRVYGDVVVRRIRSEDVWVLEVWVRGQRGWQVSITQLTQTGQGR